MPIHPFTVIPELPDYLPLDVLDSRVVVPRELDAAPPLDEMISRREERGPLPPELLDILEPDVFTTGEVALLPEHEDRDESRLEMIARGASIAAHVILICMIAWAPKWFETNVRTPEQDAIARDQLSMLYLPPSLKDMKPSPPSPKIKIDPRVLRRLEPSHPAPNELPVPEAPLERTIPNNQPSLPAQPQPAHPAKPQPNGGIASSLPRAPNPNTPTASSLGLQNLAPGQALRQSMQQALKGGGGIRYGGEDGGSQGGGGGGGQGVQLTPGLEMLTPTDGVDFNDYFQRLLASVKRNWYAIIPESARMGDKGIVYIQFRIMTNGSVPGPDPTLVRSSGKEPLDRAAMGAINASNPFEPLPSAFKRPYIELRFGFYYNLPIGSQ